MGITPTHRDRNGLAVQRLNHSATLSEQMSIIGKSNRTLKKLKQCCFAQLQYLLDSVKSSFCSIEKRLDVYVYKLERWSKQSSSFRTGLVQIVL